MIYLLVRVTFHDLSLVKYICSKKEKEMGKKVSIFSFSLETVHSFLLPEFPEQSLFSVRFILSVSTTRSVDINASAFLSLREDQMCFIITRLEIISLCRVLEA